MAGPVKASAALASPPAPAPGPGPSPSPQHSKVSPYGFLKKNAIWIFLIIIVLIGLFFNARVGNLKL